MSRRNMRETRHCQNGEKPAWTLTRDQLIDAIAGMSLPGVPKWGAQSPAAWAERLADGILGQLPPAIIKLDRELTAEQVTEIRERWAAAVRKPTL